MSISIQCETCGRQYSLAPTLAGKRVRCKQCQGVIIVPTPVAAPPMTPPLKAPSTARISAQPPAIAQPKPGRRPPTIKPALPPAPPPESDWDDAGYLQNIPPAPAQQMTAAQSFPVDNQASSAASPLQNIVSRIQSTAPRLIRRLPRQWWIWLFIVFVFLLLVGLLSDSLARVDLVLMSAMGVLTLLAGLTWSALVGVVEGGKAMLAMWAASPLAVLALMARSISKSTRNQNAAALSQLGGTQIAIAAGVGFAFIATLIGLIRNPRAFKWPMHVLGIAIVLLAGAWIPALARKELGWTDAPQAVAPQRYTSQIGAPPAMPSFTRPPGIPRNQPRTRRPEISPAAPSNVKPQPAPSAPFTPVAPALVVPNPEAPESFPVGSTAQAKWGAKWYDCTVRKSDNGWYWIEYHSDHSVEWVEPWRLRAADSTIDDLPNTHANSTFNVRNAPAPADPPKARPKK